jgi:hypothetical protein
LSFRWRGDQEKPYCRANSKQAAAENESYGLTTQMRERHARSKNSSIAYHAVWVAWLAYDSPKRESRLTRLSFNSTFIHCIDPLLHER